MSIPTAPVPDQASVSHCLLDAHGRELSAVGAEHPYYAASTIKLHVLCAALFAADRGELDLDATVGSARTFTGADGQAFTLGGDHLDPTHPGEGERIAVRELAVRMIDRSSNEATNHLVELIGLDAVAAAIKDLGLTATRVERLIGDKGAIDAGATNETSARDLAVTMRALVGAGSGLSRASQQLAREALRAQRIPVIGKALRHGVEWGSKSGWVEGYRHDVAYVSSPAGPDTRFLAVLTAGIGQDDADAQIADLVRTLLPDRAA
ncbi:MULTISPECIES: serine hydrolase [unclassified Brachybacterium]|uniref:serine hydrolase n=1 Tax=unclassified Brachybacterium TaxID=2623841 RepID=UPI00360ACA52